eukprot:gene12297-biopygen1907
MYAGIGMPGNARMPGIFSACRRPPPPGIYASRDHLAPGVSCDATPQPFLGEGGEGEGVCEEGDGAGRAKSVFFPAVPQKSAPVLSRASVFPGKGTLLEPLTRFSGTFPLAQRGELQRGTRFVAVSVGGHRESKKNRVAQFSLLHPASPTSTHPNDALDSLKLPAARVR